MGTGYYVLLQGRSNNDKHDPAGPLLLLPLPPADEESTRKDTLLPEVGMSVLEFLSVSIWVVPKVGSMLRELGPNILAVACFGLYTRY